MKDPSDQKHQTTRQSSADNGVKPNSCGSFLAICATWSSAGTHGCNCKEAGLAEVSLDTSDNSSDDEEDEGDYEEDEGDLMDDFVEVEEDVIEVSKKTSTSSCTFFSRN